MPAPASTPLPPAVLRRHKRLVSRLDELNVHLRILEDVGAAEHVAAERVAAEHVVAARMFWAEAHGMLGRGDGDAAWYALNAANRALLASATAQELEDHATLLAAEATKKLTSWRRETVLALLGARADGDLAERRRRVTLAMRVRDDHSVDRFYKINVLRQQLVLLGVILLAALAAAVTVMWALGLTFDAPMAGQRSGGPLLVLVALFGAVGGAFSASIGVARANVDGRIPDQIVAGLGAALRPLLGAAAAVVFYAFLRAGLGVRPSTDALGTYAFWAFAAGFSERLLPRTVDSTAGRVGSGDGGPGKG